MDTRQLLADIKAKLEEARIPHETIQVFGTTRCNVHIKCLSIDAASKWAALLSSVFKGAKVHSGPYVWNAAENKGTSMRPTKRRGYLVSVMA